MIEIAVVSDFNAELVARSLSASQEPPACHAVAAPFGQVFQALATTNADSDAVFVWTRPEGVVAAWQRQLDGEVVSLDTLLAEVDACADAIRGSAERHRLVLVASWVPSRVGRGMGMIDWRAEGHALRLARMNVRLAERLSGATNVFVLDAQRWLSAGKPARDGKLWYATKLPFTEAVCRAAALDVKAAVRSTFGGARKLIVVDLDDTLWGGSVGEEGWPSLRLGGHDAVGEAYLDFQRALVALSRRGVALAVVSKNDEATAFEAIDKHPEMLVRRDRLAGWRINWDDKAGNIVALALELNIGLASVVFIDDSPMERGRVREALPDVLVPDWPVDPGRFADQLRQLDCFEQPAITAEDRTRTEMYTTDRVRRTEAGAAGSHAEWLRALGVTVHVAPVDDSNRQRVAQLLNKTNQLNLRTRRLTEDELATWLGGPGDRGSVALTVRDRFGDLGLTGVLSWQASGADLDVVDFVLSCRAMGRSVEELMIALLVETAHAQGRRRLTAQWLRTERNRPCLDVWQRSRCVEEDGHRFVWDASARLSRPVHIQVLDAADVTTSIG